MFITDVFSMRSPSIHRNGWPCPEFASTLSGNPIGAYPGQLDFGLCKPLMVIQNKLLYSERSLLYIARRTPSQKMLVLHAGQVLVSRASARKM